VERGRPRRWRFGLLVVLAAVSGTAALSVSTGTESLPELGGRWAVVMIMVGRGEIPFMGPGSVETTAVLLTTMEQDGESLTLCDEYCSTTIEMEPPMAETTVPDLFMRSLVPTPRSATLRAANGATLFSQEWHTEVRGAELADPVNDPLPRDAYDRRVIDQDGDGKPGLTVPVCIPDVVGGDTYVVHRLRYRLDGRVIDPDTILGTIEWTSEQNIVLATDAVLMMSVSLPADPDASRHRFLMVRVDDSWTCERLRAELPALLARMGASET